MDFSLCFSLVTTLVLSLRLLTGLSVWTILCVGLLCICSRAVHRLVRILTILWSPLAPAYPPSWDSLLLLLLLVQGGCSSPQALWSPVWMWRNHSQCGQKSETVLLTCSQELSCIGCELNLHLRAPSLTTIILLEFTFRKPLFHPVLWTSWSLVPSSDWKSILSFLCWWFTGTVLA